MTKLLTRESIAIAVVWASRVLPAGAKALWQKHVYLDRGPDGCWMSSEEMASLLGAEKETIVTYRQRLVDLGLLRKGTDSGTRRRWYTILPGDLPAPERFQKLPTAAIVAAAKQLDEDLHRAGGWPKSRTRVRPDPDQSPTLAIGQNGESRTGVRLGGSGGSSINEHVKHAHLSVPEEDRGAVDTQRDDRGRAPEESRADAIERKRAGFMRAAKEAAP